MAAKRRPEVERAAVLYLYYQQGYGIRRIARILGRPVATVAGWVKQGPSNVKNPRLRMISQQAYDRYEHLKGSEEPGEDPDIEAVMNRLEASERDECPCGFGEKVEDCTCPKDCPMCDCSDTPGWQECHDITGAAIGPTIHPTKHILSEDEPVGTTPYGDPSLGNGGPQADSEGIKVAGLAVLARDTGRLLMLYRGSDPEDPAENTWEFPGGHLEPGETLSGAAAREWSEEVGQPFCWASANSLGGWRSSNGVYAGFVVSIPRESDLNINGFANGRATQNPDDPENDEGVRWWDQSQLPMEDMRPELAKDWRKVTDIIEGKRTLHFASAPYNKRNYQDNRMGKHRGYGDPMGRMRGNGMTAKVNPFPEGDIENVHPRRAPDIRSPGVSDEPSDGLESARQHPQQEPPLKGPTDTGRPVPLKTQGPWDEPGRAAIDARAIDAMRRYFNLLAGDVAHEHALKAAQRIDPDFIITPEQAVRAWDALGMLDQPRKFTEPTGADLMRSHLRLVGDAIIRFGWSPGTIKPPEYVTSVYDQYEWGEDKIKELSEVLYSIIGQNYLEGINQQLISLGEPIVTAVTDPAILRNLQDVADQAAEGIAETFNRELGGQVYQQWVDLRAERGRQMSRWWLEHAIDQWVEKRAPWKARQVSMTEGARAFNAGVRNFVERNRQLEAARFDVSPCECQCQECVDLVDGNPYTWEQAQNLPLPAHPNCPHILVPVYEFSENLGQLWAAQAPEDSRVLTASEIIDFVGVEKPVSKAAQRLRDYWSDKGTPKNHKKAHIGWDTPPRSDFNACVVRVSKFMTEEQAKGYCALRHHDATGEWPGHAPGERWAKHSEDTNEPVPFWEYNPAQPRSTSGKWTGPTPTSLRKAKPKTPEVITPGMTPSQKAHVTAHNTASADAEAKIEADRLEREAREVAEGGTPITVGGLSGRAGGAGESNFGISTGNVGDIGETLFMDGIAPDLEKRYGKISRVTWAVKDESGKHGPRNTPLDFISSDGYGIEVKTVNAKSKNLKTAIKAEEKARKLQALQDMGLAQGVTLLQIADTENGVMTVYAADGFVSKTVRGMEKIGTYKFPVGVFNASELLWIALGLDEPVREGV